MRARTPDERYMAEAIRLAARGYPAPNPHVGCVIVRNGEVVGRGFHDHAGGHHAEAAALAQAGENARGATAYVTLEPCDHHGRTGPCSGALVAAGVSRVVAAVPDPNPRAAGGAATLRAAGVAVEFGVLASEAERVAWQFLFSTRAKRPYVVVKAALSLDGRIALPSGESQWITGAEAREVGHRLRADLGAVLVGRGTAQADDPSLTARVPGVPNPPLRVVLDPESKLPDTLRLFDDQAPTWRVTAADLPIGPHGFDLDALMEDLHGRGVTGVLVEGGARTIASFLRARLVDRLELFVAPKLLGDGPAWVEGLGLVRLESAPEFVIDRTRRLGRDLWISASPIFDGP